MSTDNAATLEEIRREVLKGNFTGRIILHCAKGAIEDVEVHERRKPVRQGNLTVAQGGRK